MQRAVSSVTRRVLPTPASPPDQDDGRFGICGPPPGGLEGLELLDAADEGGARHAAAHLAGIIARDRPEGNGGRKEPPANDGEPVAFARRQQAANAAGTWHSPVGSSASVQGCPCLVAAGPVARPPADQRSIAPAD